MKNIEWLPMMASIGIGAAAYSMMTGRGGQLQSFLPVIANMMNQQGQMGQKQQGGASQHQKQQNSMGTLAQQAQQGQHQNQNQNHQPPIH